MAEQLREDLLAGGHLEFVFLDRRLRFFDLVQLGIVNNRVTLQNWNLVLILPDGRHAYLEAKAEHGRLSEAQEWFRRELIVRGVPYVVFRSLDDLESFIRHHDIPNRLAERRTA